MCERNSRKIENVFVCDERERLRMCVLERWCGKLRECEREKERKSETYEIDRNRLIEKRL